MIGMLFRGLNRLVWPAQIGYRKKKELGLFFQSKCGEIFSGVELYYDTMKINQNQMRLHCKYLWREKK